MELTADIRAAVWDNVTCNKCCREVFIQDESLTFLHLYNAGTTPTAALCPTEGQGSKLFTSQSFAGIPPPVVLLLHLPHHHPPVSTRLSGQGSHLLLQLWGLFPTFQVWVEKFSPLLDLKNIKFSVLWSFYLPGWSNFIKTSHSFGFFLTSSRWSQAQTQMSAWNANFEVSILSFYKNSVRVQMKSVFKVHLQLFKWEWKICFFSEKTFQLT